MAAPMTPAALRNIPLSQHARARIALPKTCAPSSLHYHPSPAATLSLWSSKLHRPFITQATSTLAIIFTPSGMCRVA